MNTAAPLTALSGLTYLAHLYVDQPFLPRFLLQHCNYTLFDSGKHPFRRVSNANERYVCLMSILLPSFCSLSACLVTSHLPFDDLLMYLCANPDLLHHERRNTAKRMRSIQSSLATVLISSRSSSPQLISNPSSWAPISMHI